MKWIADPRRWLGPWIVPWLLAGGIFSLVAFSASHYGLTWDEPNYFVASDLEVQWFGELFRGLLPCKGLSTFGAS